jgi:hypothetical protein
MTPPDCGTTDPDQDVIVQGRALVEVFHDDPSQYEFGTETTAEARPGALVAGTVSDDPSKFVVVIDEYGVKKQPIEAVLLATVDEFVADSKLTGAMRTSRRPLTPMLSTLRTTLSPPAGRHVEGKTLVMAGFDGACDNHGIDNNATTGSGEQVVNWSVSLFLSYCFRSTVNSKKSPPSDARNLAATGLVTAPLLNDTINKALETLSGNAHMARVKTALELNGTGREFVALSARSIIVPA